MDFKHYNIKPEPFTVICELVHQTQVSSYDVLQFDGILAAAVVREQFGGQRLPDVIEPHNIPLPLKSLWRDERGYNLWAASSLLPMGETTEDVVWMHKRAQTGEFTKHNSNKTQYKLNTITGRFMERRIPVPTMVVEKLTARCIGDIAEAKKLLENITHIGKRRNAGLGEVKQWSVEAALWNDIDIITDGSQLIKPLPYEANNIYNIQINEMPTECSWFPPYWHSGCQGGGWRTGTMIG